MPFIDTNLHDSNLVDVTQVVINFKQLSELLRLVIDSNNDHEKSIEALKKQLAQEKARGDAMEKSLAAATATHTVTGEKIKTAAEVDLAVMSLKESFDAFRLSVERERLEKTTQYSDRFTNIEKDVAAMVSSTDRTMKDLSASNTKTTSALSTLEKRVTAINASVPDIKPLQQQCEQMKLFCDRYEQPICVGHAFAKCWGGDEKRIIRLAAAAADDDEGKKKANADDATNSSSAAQPSPATPNANTTPTASQSSEECRDYLLSLPCFIACREQWRACDDFQKKAVDAKLERFGFIDANSKPSVAARGNTSMATTPANSPTPTPTNNAAAVNNSSNAHNSSNINTSGNIALVAAELKEYQLTTRNALNFIDKRLSEVDGLARRVTALEENARALGIHKADVGAVAAVVGLGGGGGGFSTGGRRAILADGVTEGEADVVARDIDASAVPAIAASPPPTAASSSSSPPFPSAVLLQHERQLALMSQHLSTLRDGLGVVMDKVGIEMGLVGGGRGMDHAGNNSTTNPPLPIGGSRLYDKGDENEEKDGDSRKNTAAATVASSSSDDGDVLRKRVSALEAEAERLEKAKANRAELDKFFSFLATVDPEAVKRGAFTSPPTAATAATNQQGGGASQSYVLPPLSNIVTPGMMGNDAVNAFVPTLVGSGLGGAGAVLSPHRPLHHSSLTGVPTVNTSSTNAAPTTTASTTTSAPAGALLSSSSPASPTRRPLRNGSGAAGNVSPPPSSPPTAGGGGGSARGVFLGRSVAVVRDASGGTIPAYIGGSY